MNIQSKKLYSQKNRFTGHPQDDTQHHADKPARHGSLLCRGRDTLVYPKIDREKCIGCGRCYISCSDGGHQAISFNADTRQPQITGTKCVGCHLCRLVCPTGAVGVAKRINKKQ